MACSLWFNLFLSLTLFVERAQACAVCGADAGREQVLEAYFSTTLLLMGIPMTLIGCFALWFYFSKRKKKALIQESEKASL